MKSTTAAVRYAKALFMLAREERCTREIRSELEGFATLLRENAELRDSLLTPLHPADERKAVVSAVFERTAASALLRKFCLYLIDQRRLLDFETIEQEFARLADEEAGLTTAYISSASPLDERRKDRLRRALSMQTGQEVRLETEIDPGLIGGAIAKVGDRIFDGSLRTQLAQLRATLMKGS